MTGAHQSEGTAETADVRAVETVDLTVEGMTCASCAARIERKLSRAPGVVSATVNFATDKAQVQYAPPADPETLVSVVRDTGYAASVLTPRATPTGEASEPSAEVEAQRLRLEVSAALTVPVVVLSMVPALQFPGWQWAVLLFATPVVFWGAAPFTTAALRHLRNGQATMDTLVAIGVLAAYGYSVYALIAGGAGRIGMRMGFSLVPDPAGSHAAEIYFEVAAGVTTFLLLGRYLESRAKRSAGSALRALLQLGVRDVTVLRGSTREVLPLEQLAVGDRFLVRPGDKVAADGVVEEGASAIDGSLLTGESVPVEVSPGDPVTGGTLNAGGSLVVRTTRVGADTVLASIARRVEEAQSGKAAVQRLADRVSGVFVPVVLVLATMTLGFWLGRGAGLQFALTAAVAVLIIACPCALGLATPTALLAGTGRGAQLGVLIRGPEVLERAGGLDTVVLDKTGTLTSGAMQLHEVVAGPDDDPREVLRRAASLELLSEHPIGRAVARGATATFDALPDATDFASDAGRGVRATVDGVPVVVGRPEWVANQGMALSPQLAEVRRQSEEDGITVAAVGWQRRVRGLLLVADAVRPTSAEAVEALRRLGLRPILLTGDAAAVARRVGAELGIDDVRAELLPEDKLQAVRALQAEGRRVVMAGDGVNDAAALAQADLGVAMGTGSDAAIEAGDLTVVRSDPRLIADGIALARRTLGIIRGNLFWAFAYNVAALPLAASGWLNPLVAGAAMAFSSVFVVLNSLRLRAYVPPRAGATVS